VEVVVAVRILAALL
jgi:hypothetical protein